MVMKRLTKARLAITLSKLPGFVGAKEEWEQYLTDSEIAAEVLWQAAMLGDVEGKAIVDLGCGGGILGLGCLLLGAANLTFVDIDLSALEQAKISFAKMKSEGLFVSDGTDELTGEIGDHTLFIGGDVAAYKGKADIIVMNPPFGTRQRHADREFLEKAIQIAPVVYSFHKSETLSFLREFAARNGFKITHEWGFQFPLKASMKHHRRRIHRIEVCCIRLVKQKSEGI